MTPRSVLNAVAVFVVRLALMSLIVLAAVHAASPHVLTDAALRAGIDPTGRGGEFVRSVGFDFPDLESQTHWVPHSPSEGVVVTFASCDIAYRVDPADAPADAELVTAEAFDDLSADSGFNLVPFAGAPPGLPVIDVYWSAPDDPQRPPGDAAGMGGAVYSIVNHEVVASGGTVQIDAERSAELTRVRTDGDSLHALLRHEAAHVLGLGHSSDPDSLMRHRMQHGRAHLTAGDRAGFAVLADAAGCGR